MTSKRYIPGVGDVRDNLSLGAAIRLAEFAADQLKAAESRASRYGPEPSGGDGTVIRFAKRFQRSGKIYTYAGIRADGLWYLSGKREQGQARTWDELVDFLSGGVPAEHFQVLAYGQPAPVRNDGAPPEVHTTAGYRHSSSKIYAYAGWPPQDSDDI